MGYKSFVWPLTMLKMLLQVSGNHINDPGVNEMSVLFRLFKILYWTVSLHH